MKFGWKKKRVKLQQDFFLTKGEKMQLFLLISIFLPLLLELVILKK